MNIPNRNFNFIWIPRMLAIMFILFISLFALDAFSTEASFLENLAGFLIHLTPSIVLLTALIISWKHPKFGGFLFLFLGIVFTVFFKTYSGLAQFLAISFPPIVTGTLFIISHTSNKEPSKL